MKPREIGAPRLDIRFLVLEADVDEMPLPVARSSLRDSVSGRIDTAAIAFSTEAVSAGTHVAQILGVPADTNFSPESIPIHVCDLALLAYRRLAAPMPGAFALQARSAAQSTPSLIMIEIRNRSKVRRSYM